MARFKSGDILVVSPHIDTYLTDAPPGILPKMRRVGKRVVIVRISDPSYQHSAYGVTTTLYLVRFLEDNPLGKAYYFLEEWLAPTLTLETKSIYDYNRKEKDYEKV